jgi:hypothetical protein
MLPVLMENRISIIFSCVPFPLFHWSFIFLIFQFINHLLKVLGIGKSPFVASAFSAYSGSHFSFYITAGFPVSDHQQRLRFCPFCAWASFSITPIILVAHTLKT